MSFAYDDPAHRWDKTYEATRMKDVPHRVLTRPKKAFELFFDGSRNKGRGRESVLRLETIASGRVWQKLLATS
jgi:protein arginine N-methyltransferase 7